MLTKLLKNRLFIILLFLKIILLAFFSSGYKEQLFVPFVNHFVTNHSNPWQHDFINNSPNAFPYPAGMLYVLSIFDIFTQFFSSLIIRNFIFKLPLLVSDIVILIFLVKLYPTKSKEVLTFYFASPIIFYASYIHSQLDLIPTALLIISIYYLVKEKKLVSAIWFGLAISTKFHVIAALPLILIFLWKRSNRSFFHLIIPPVMYVVISLPFIFSDGFIQYVFRNKEQMQIFNVTFPISGISIYMPLLVVMMIYIRFSVYKKINNDLLFSYIGLLFSAFLLFVPPMPAWYIWIVPFLCIYFINAYQRYNEKIYILDAILSLSYLVYFVLFHTSIYNDIIFNNKLIEIKIMNEQLKNISFTLLTSCLLAVVYYLYTHGVRSNSMYRKNLSAFTIGIGGDSGSGKSTLLHDIKLLLFHKRILEIEGDGDHKWERGDINWESYTHLNPKANFLHRQSEHLTALKRGENVERVIYDHNTGTFSSPIITKPNDFIVLSGLHPFYLPKMRKNIDLKIYIETEEKLRSHWKVLRDTNKRGYSKEKVLQQINIRLPDAQKYIHPQKSYADLIITYFSDQDFPIGDPQFTPRTLVKFALDSNIDLEPLVSELGKEGDEFEHDYSEDLRTQYLIIKEQPKQLNFQNWVDRLVPNKEEIISNDASFLTGMQGLTQIVILILIADKMKEDKFED
ncbi:uridine kinase [Paenibacillus sp. LMG 31460]|uniref:Phosphoribulokinase n=1 Tax=Paenibacillus germinis TaxID=2654979 RepID=A0ABX1Z4Z8_9BACL|nr:uridine kinase [Paenibacillus germinis]NOU87914.1 uridine kinase [Paenibacillus germinis]